MGYLKQMTARFALVSLASLWLGFTAIAHANTPLDIRAYEAASECRHGSGQIEVTVTQTTAEGILTVELYRPSDRDFLKKASRVHRIRVPSVEDQITLCFEPQPSGRYAIAAYQDTDADRDLDRKWNGLPNEPFGLSTNARLRLAIPKFEDADFDVPASGTSITIDLRR